MTETFDWLKPSLLWQANAQDTLDAAFLKPVLLEFTTDSFMNDFLAAASRKQPAAFQSLLLKKKGSADPKLFQPAHGNFYLTSASLCCRQPGFPDRQLQKGDGENVFFVLRKLVNGVEYGWKNDATGKGWQSLGSAPKKILPTEERLPLIPAVTGQSRNIFFGYIPVSSQEAYSAAPSASPAGTETGDARHDEFNARIIEPLKDPATLFSTGIVPTTPVPVLSISVYLLLDMLEFFDQYLPEVGKSLRANPNANPNSAETALKTFLQGQALGGSLKLAGALGTVAAKQSQLNQPGNVDPLQLGFNNDYNLQTNLLNLVTLEADVKAALDSRPETQPAPLTVPKLGKTDENEVLRYILRYVYERPQCYPPHTYISQPTDQFELAPFFDPEAPARPIRIGLPTDVSIGGLRKLKKNVAFMMSTDLRNKMQSINKDMLKGDPPDAEGGLNIGHICSFSLPIITLCAFILLMIIVIILNIVFWWMPFLKICFPLKLKASG
jgi:hypothetical protein